MLRLIEYGAAGEARDLEVRCETCEKRRRMSEAFGEAGKASMPTCRGRRPHLRDFDEEPCAEQAKAILLGSSNLWFPDVLTTLAIPTASTRLDQTVESHWATLKQAQSLENVELIRNLGLLGDLRGYTTLEIWQAVERRRQQMSAGEEDERGLDLKRPEWELFCASRSPCATALTCACAPCRCRPASRAIAGAGGAGGAHARGAGHDRLHPPGRARRVGRRPDCRCTAHAHQPQQAGLGPGGRGAGRGHLPPVSGGGDPGLAQPAHSAALGRGLQRAPTGPGARRASSPTPKRTSLACASC